MTAVVSLAALLFLLSPAMALACRLSPGWRDRAVLALLLHPLIGLLYLYAFGSLGWMGRFSLVVYIGAWLVAAARLPPPPGTPARQGSAPLGSAAPWVLATVAVFAYVALQIRPIEVWDCPAVNALDSGQAWARTGRFGLPPVERYSLSLNPVFYGPVLTWVVTMELILTGHEGEGSHWRWVPVIYLAGLLLLVMEVSAPLSKRIRGPIALLVLFASPAAGRLVSTYQAESIVPFAAAAAVVFMGRLLDRPSPADLLGALLACGLALNLKYYTAPILLVTLGWVLLNQGAAGARSLLAALPWRAIVPIVLTAIAWPLILTVQYGSPFFPYLAFGYPRDPRLALLASMNNPWPGDLWEKVAPFHPIILAAVPAAAIALARGTGSLAGTVRVSLTLVVAWATLLTIFLPAGYFSHKFVNLVWPALVAIVIDALAWLERRARAAAVRPAVSIALGLVTVYVVTQQVTWFVPLLPSEVLLPTPRVLEVCGQAQFGGEYRPLVGYLRRLRQREGRDAILLAAGLDQSAVTAYHLREPGERLWDFRYLHGYRELDLVLDRTTSQAIGRMRAAGVRYLVTARWPPWYFLGLYHRRSRGEPLTLGGLERAGLRQTYPAAGQTDPYGFVVLALGDEAPHGGHHGRPR